MVNILKYNLHWKEYFRYHYEIKRDLFHEISPYVDARQIIGVIGLRRTAKVTGQQPTHPTIIPSIPSNHLRWTHPSRSNQPGPAITGTMNAA